MLIHKTNTGLVKKDTLWYDTPALWVKIRRKTTTP